MLQTITSRAKTRKNPTILRGHSPLCKLDPDVPGLNHQSHQFAPPPTNRFRLALATSVCESNRRAFLRQLSAFSFTPFHDIPLPNCYRSQEAPRISMQRYTLFPPRPEIPVYNAKALNCYEVQRWLCSLSSFCEVKAL